MQAASGLFHFVRFDDQIFVNSHRFQVFPMYFGSHPAYAAEAINLAHHFIEHGCNDSAVDKTAAALIFRAKPEISYNAPSAVVLLKREQHSARIGAATTETYVRRIGFEQHIVRLKPRETANRFARRVDASVFQASGVR